MDQMHLQRTQKPLISFIITSYNIPIEMIKKCIHNLLLLSLSKEEREIILVDDGSDISLINEITEIRDDLIYIRQKNNGLSAARNLGIKMASGKYIHFIDGDDFVIPVPYEHCLDIVRYKSPDIVIFKITDKPQNNTPFSYSQPVSGCIYMKNNNLVASACGYIFRKDILGNLKFEYGIMHEDEYFTPQLFLRAETVICAETEAYYYRKRNNSITNNKDKSHIYKRLSDFESVIFHLQSLIDTIPDTDKPALARRISQLTMDYIYNIISLTHNHEYLNKAITRLEEHRLFPLSSKNYTKKYTLFRKIINNKILRNILFTITTK